MSKDSSSAKKVFNPKWFGISIFSATVIFYTSQILPVIVLSFVFYFSGMNKSEFSDLFVDNPQFQLLVMFLVAGLGIFLVYRYLKWRGEKPLNFLMLTQKYPNYKQVGEVIVTYGLYFVTLIVATIILTIFLPIDVNQAQDLGISRPGTTSGLVYIFITLVMIAPISEEILFRGFLFGSLSKYSSKIIATIAVSIIFGMAHLEYGNLNWIAVVDTLIFSVYLIYISQKHKSLYSSMLLHAMKNGIAFYVLFVR